MAAAASSGRSRDSVEVQWIFHWLVAAVVSSMQGMLYWGLSEGRKSGMHPGPKPVCLLSYWQIRQQGWCKAVMWLAQSQVWSILLYVGIGCHPSSYWLLFWQFWFTVRVLKALHFNAAVILLIPQTPANCVVLDTVPSGNIWTLKLYIQCMNVIALDMKIQNTLKSV